MEAATQPTAPETPPEPGTKVPTAPPGAPQGTGPSPETGDGERDETGRYLSREAASCRRRLRETEADRDQLRERLLELQRAEVERVAARAGMAVPGDFWSTGTELQNLRDDQGRIEADTVEALVSDVLRSRPTWRGRNGDLGIGKGGAAAGHGSKVGLSQLLKPGHG